MDGHRRDVLLSDASHDKRNTVTTEEDYEMDSISPWTVREV